MSIVVVTNPRSRRNRLNPALVQALADRLGDGGEIAAPDDLDALAALAERTRSAQIDLLCINGGDGTIHQVLTAFVRSWGEDRALPPVCVLRGGTMNIIADSIGVTLDAEAMLARAVQAPATAATTARRTMRIEVDDNPPLYGFLSGNGIIARYLELYYADPDPSPRSAASLLLRGAVSAMVQGPLIRELTRPYRGEVRIDGERLPSDRWVAVALGTIEQMGLGFRVFDRIHDHPDKLQVVAIGSGVSALATELPSLYRGRGVRREGNHSLVAAAVDLDADEPIPLMIDGDFCRSETGRVRIRPGPLVTFWTG